MPHPQHPGATAGRVILLHPQAPAQPATGAPCNGCGVCCAAEPCPLGIVLSRRRRGSCVALLWSDADAHGPPRYHCGVLVQPQHWLPLLPAPWARWLGRRWIAAGRGCDCTLRHV